MPDFSLKRTERLRSPAAVAELFSQGQSVHTSSLRLLYLEKEQQDHPALMAVSVPKRMYKRAVDRNLIKRRIREAYRRHKPELYNYLIKNNISLRLVILYTDKEIQEFRTIQKQVIKGLEKVVEKASEEQ